MMKVRTIGRFLVIGGILALLIAGCGVTISINTNANATPTPTKSIDVKMTQTTQVKPTLTKVPTAPPQPTATPTPALPTMKEYTHTSNSFSIFVPVDWTSSEDTGSVSLSSPDNNAFVVLEVENTVNTLNADAFTQAINAYEFNLFSPYKNYKEITREVQADKGYAIIAKTLDLNLVPHKAVTIYQQQGKVLYVQLYLTTVSAASQSGPIFTAMKDSFKSNPDNAEGLSPFTSVFPYTDPDNLYNLSIPSLWTFDDVSKNGSVIQYTSPDANAIILLVKMDLGKAVTRALADSTALDLLKRAYGDVSVSKTETLENGSIQNTWAPKAGGLVGLSIYKWSGTTWFFLAWAANTGFEDVYGPVFNQSIASYQIPQ